MTRHVSVHEKGFQVANASPEARAARRTGVLRVSMLALAGLLVFVVVAGSAQAVLSENETKFRLDHNTLSTSTRLVKITVTNDDANDALAETITSLRFTAPASWGTPIKAGSYGPTGWTNTSTFPASEITFTAPQGGGIPAQQSQDFFLVLEAPDISTDAVHTWVVRSFGSVTSGGVNNDMRVGVSTLGVHALTITAPSGATDNLITKGQTVTLNATIYNRGATNLSSLRVKVTSTKSGDPTNFESQLFTAVSRNHAGNGVTQLEFQYTFGTASGTRDLTSNLTGTGTGGTISNKSRTIEAFNAPSFTITSLTLDAGQPGTVTANVDLANVTFPNHRALNRTTVFTARLKHSGTVSDAVAEDIEVVPRFIHESGADHTSRFVVARFDAANGNITSLAGTATSGDLRFSVTPARCLGSDCSQVPPDGKYNVTLDLLFFDQNTRNSTIAKTALSVASNPTLFRVDSTVPVLTGAALPPVVEYQRGNNPLTLTLNTTDATLDDTNVKFVVLDMSRFYNGTAVGGSTLSPSDPQGLRFVLDNFTMTKSGGDWTYTRDFSNYALGSYHVYALATDRAGNFYNFTGGTVQLLDTTRPTISNVIAPATATLSTPVTFSATVTDNFQVSQVFVQAHHAETNQDIFKNATLVTGATSDGLPMTCQGNCGPANSGTWVRGVTMPLSGTYTIKVFAKDASTPTPRTQISAGSALTVTSGVALFVNEGGTQSAGKNLTTSAQVSQVNPGVFTNIELINEALGTESFNFKCSVLAETTVANAPSCSVNTAAGQEQSFPGTFNVSIYKANPKTFLNNDTGLQNMANQQLERLTVHVTAPPSARPGDIVRIQLTAKPIFGTSGANIILGYVVTEGRGLELKFADGGTRPTGGQPTPLDGDGTITRVLKPTRATAYTFRVTNPGNVETTYNLTAVLGNFSSTTGWVVDLASTDSRWNDQANSIRVGPAGSPSGLNSALINVVVTAPASVKEADFAAIVPTVTITATTPSVTTKTLVLSLVIKDPTVAVGTWDATSVSSFGGGINSTGPVLHDGKDGRPAQNCSPVPLGTECTYIQGNWTTFVLRASITSTLNKANEPGRLQASLIVTTPCGESCPATTATNVQGTKFGEYNLTMVPVSGQVQGHNGTYEARVNVTDEVGRFFARIYVTDDRGFFLPGDAFTTANVSFGIHEPAQALPTTCCVEVFEGNVTTALARDSNGAYRANFGSPIRVKVTLDDPGGGLGRAVLSVERQNPAGVVAQVPMGRLASPAPVVAPGATNRIINATFEGAFTPSGSFLDTGGVYIFRIRAFDANNTEAFTTAQTLFFIDLADLVGPDIRPKLVAGAFQGAPLTVLVDSPVNITATITDKSDPAGSPGGAINRTAGRVPFALLTRGTVVKNYTLTQVPGTLNQWNVAIPAADINTSGTYTVDIFAWDLSNNGAKNTTTLVVSPDLVPQVTVSSPPPTGNVRFLGGTTNTVTLGIQANLDPSASDALVVEAIRGAATTRLTTTLNGTAPSLTATFEVGGGDGNATIRVTVKDIKGNTNTTTFEVRVDNTPPSPIAISVSPLDLAGKTHRPSTSDNLRIAPGTRLQVTASDSGSDVGSVSIRATGPSGSKEKTLASPSSTFTLADSDLFGAGVVDGDYVIGATVRDRVGNSRTTSTENVTVVVDGTDPLVSTIRPSDPLSVEVTDLRAGVRSVEVAFGSTAGSLGTTFAMTRGNGNTWTGDFPAEASGTVFFVVRATDNVGNTVDAQCGTAPCQLAFGNRAPIFGAVTVTSNGTAVQAGGVVKGSVAIGWTATDPEGADVLVTIKVKDAANPETTLATDRATGPVTWDTTTVRDGAYTITLTGTDGRLTNATTFNVVVRNVVVDEVIPLPRSVNQGGSLVLAYEVGHPSKKVKSVAAVLRVGTERETVTLHDDGTHGDRTAQDGTWSATYTPRLRGQHAVDLQVTYEGESTPTTVSNVGTFQAQGGASAAATPPTFFAVAALAVLVVVLGVFGIRRWQ